MILLDAALPRSGGKRVARPIHYTRGFISFMNYPSVPIHPPAPSAARLAQIMVPTPGGPGRASIGRSAKRVAAPSARGGRARTHGRRARPATGDPATAGNGFPSQVASSPITHIQ
jgi:hypothetical protein